MKEPLNIQPKRELKKLHAVLTYNNYVFDKMEQTLKFSGCINRDKNSVLNMQRIVNHLILYGTRPELFKRGKNSDQPNGQLVCCVENVHLSD